MDYFYTANLSIAASPQYPLIPVDSDTQVLRYSCYFPAECLTGRICARLRHHYMYTREEWEYAMRREMQEILPNVFLGPYAAATKSKHMQLCQFGISHIICIRHHAEANCIKPNFPDQFRYMVLDISDSQTENIIRFFPEVKEFIDVCLHGNGKCLVHGNAGISRSAALVIAYIMETYGLTYRDAFKVVQHKRFCINPNEGFQQQLVEYEPICKARAQQAITNIGNQQPHDTGLKRRHDDDEDEENTAHTSRMTMNNTMLPS